MMQRKRFAENETEYIRKDNYYLPNLAVSQNNKIRQPKKKVP